ncbi:MAG: anaerobic sulfatase maturase [Desulfobacula sp.]|jgi:uncharacterized protein
MKEDCNIRTNNTTEGIHIVAKPVGPACNLRCEYCFYLEKQALFEGDRRYRMSDDVLKAFVSKYIESQPTPVVDFVWQGGEPTLLGTVFFKRVVELQRPFVSKKIIRNALQTNGTMLSDEWCEFLKRHNFMVGLSLDGPEDIHDRYRRDRKGKGTFQRVMHGLKLLQKHNVEYNVLTSVTDYSAKRPLDVYCFLKECGVEFIQFTPIVERLPDTISNKLGLRLAHPSSPNSKEPKTKITHWSVMPEEYGDFLITIYENWVRNDVGKVFVMNFEWALNAWIGNPSPICVHADQCGRALAIEHNGSIYACDHLVYPEYKIGDIFSGNLLSMAESSAKSNYGKKKETALPGYCRECDVLAACRGGCPKHRFAKTDYGEPGLHYLCSGYKKFFLHIRKYLRVMTTLLENGLPASEIMKALEGPLIIKLK